MARSQQSAVTLCFMRRQEADAQLLFSGQNTHWEGSLADLKEKIRRRHLQDGCSHSFSLLWDAAQGLWGISGQSQKMTRVGWLESGAAKPRAISRLS